ncbi:MAG TPA: outer membrane beta-barrel protein [Terracidiphilus sp.]|jgi:opacity protein-like surface antigen
MRLKIIFMGLLLALAAPAFPQAKPAAELRSPQLLIGAGFTDFSSDWATTRDISSAEWIDWKPNLGPSALKGLGIEAEYREYQYAQIGSQSLTQSTVGGGPIYTVQHWPDIHPYAKFLINNGQMIHTDNSTIPTTYPTTSWLTWAPGGGIEYRAWGNLWVREDYEYQYWRTNLKPGDNHFLNPNGFTIGISYDLGRLHRGH